MPEEDLVEGKKVIVVLNVKGSRGMILCSRDDEYAHQQFIKPPEGSAVGESICLQGCNRAKQQKYEQVWKHNVNDLLIGKLGRNDQLEVSYNGRKMTTSAGIVQAKSFANSKYFC